MSRATFFIALPIVSCSCWIFWRIVEARPAFWKESLKNMKLFIHGIYFKYIYFIIRLLFFKYHRLWTLQCTLMGFIFCHNSTANQRSHKRVSHFQVVYEKTLAIWNYIKFTFAWARVSTLAQTKRRSNMRPCKRLVSPLHLQNQRNLSVWLKIYMYE